MAYKNKVPDRWEKYTDMGRIIPGTRFIAFKVPLRQEILQRVKNASWFCPRTLMDHCQNLGLVIDLTDTLRYYSPEEFESRGVTHVKIRVMGKRIPEEKAVHKFFQAVNKFLEKNKENEKVIGVHCTHGLNRTGYLVCRYMIQVLGIPPDQAIADFNSARGHEQEREYYLEDLRVAPWMNEPVTKYTKSSSSSGYHASADYADTPPLDNSSASLDSTANSSALDTTASESESPGGVSFRPGRSWNNPLLQYPRRPHAGRGHRPAAPPPDNRFGAEKPLLCSRCQQPGHFARACPNSGPDGRPLRNNPPAKPSSSDAPRAAAATPQPGDELHSERPTQQMSCTTCRRKGGPGQLSGCPECCPLPTHSSAAAVKTTTSCPDANDLSPSPSGKKEDTRPQHDSAQSDAQGRIKQLEELVQQQQRQIEELSRRLQACQCGRVSVPTPADADSAQRPPPDTPTSTAIQPDGPLMSQA